MNYITESAIAAVNKSISAFCKFISANDAGATGAHQSGFYIPKSCWSLMFDKQGIKGENSEHFITIKWQNDFETDSRFIYYGTGTRNEYRLTRFGKGFPFLEESNVGDLIILCRVDIHYYEGYILSTDDDIEDFFTAFNLSSDQTNKLIEKTSLYSPEDALKALFDNFIKEISVFPATNVMAAFARETYIRTFGIKNSAILNNPDNILLKWIESEYELFKASEIKLYGEHITKPFSSVEDLIVFSNTILNRRKSRAGKSLEHHLSEIFITSGLHFEQQIITEDAKKPDFIFPGGFEYHNPHFPTNNLTFLGAKTTCKDRWRQILNEADRIPVKHLFTLQQGISKNQLAEMYSNNVCLVVPQPYLDSFDKSFRDKILTLKQFVSVVSFKQKSVYLSTSK